MTGFAEFLRSLGLMPRQVVADGRWHRCATEAHPKKRNGAWKLAVDGMIGFAQDWASMTEPATWRPSVQGAAPTVDVAAMRAAEAEARAARYKAQDAARLFYSGCTGLRGGHPYLEAHGLDVGGCWGIRVDGEGWLVVPVMRGGILLSVQRISPDGTKRFWRNAPVGGGSYDIARSGATVAVLCEGLATGLAVHRALRTCRVVVCFDSGNLTKFAPRPAGLVVIAADNDHGTQERTGKNPGLEAARQAGAILKAGVASPEGIAGTDWADYRMEHVAARMAKRYDGKPTVAQIGMAVDSEIADAINRRAVFG